MPLPNDGNERDVRIRPDASVIPGADAALTGPIPPGTPCDTVGTQTDLPVTSYSVVTPSSEFLQAYDWTDLSIICPRGLDMRSIEKIIFQLLVTHFSSADKIIDSNLKGLVYNPNPMASKIRISLNTAFDIASAGKLPAIIVKRGEQKFSRIGLGDRGDMYYPPEEGKRPFVRTGEGVHQILSISAVPGEAEGLAVELTELFTGLSPVLREELPFVDFEVVGVSELQLAEELGNRSLVAVHVAYKYEYGWTLRSVTPLAQRILSSMLVQTTNS